MMMQQPPLLAAALSSSSSWLEVVLSQLTQQQQPAPNADNDHQHDRDRDRDVGDDGDEEDAAPQLCALGVGMGLEDVVGGIIAASSSARTHNQSQKKSSSSFTGVSLYIVVCPDTASSSSVTALAEGIEAALQLHHYHCRHQTTGTATAAGGGRCCSNSSSSNSRLRVHCMSEGAAVKERTDAYSAKGYRSGRGGGIGGLVIVLRAPNLCADLLHSRVPIHLVKCVVVAFRSESSSGGGGANHSLVSDKALPPIAFCVELFLHQHDEAVKMQQQAVVAADSKKMIVNNKLEMSVVTDSFSAIQHAMCRSAATSSNPTPLDVMLHVGGTVRLFPRFRHGVVLAHERAAKIPIDTSTTTPSVSSAPHTHSSPSSSSMLLGHLPVEVPVAPNPTTQRLKRLLEKVLLELLNELKSAERRLRQTSSRASSFSSTATNSRNRKRDRTGADEDEGDDDDDDGSDRHPMKKGEVGAKAKQTRNAGNSRNVRPVWEVPVNGMCDQPASVGAAEEGRRNRHHNEKDFIISFQPVAFSDLMDAHLNGLHQVFGRLLRSGHGSSSASTSATCSPTCLLMLLPQSALSLPQNTPEILSVTFDEIKKIVESILDIRYLHSILERTSTGMFLLRLEDCIMSTDVYQQLYNLTSSAKNQQQQPHHPEQMPPPAAVPPPQPQKQGAGGASSSTTGRRGVGVKGMSDYSATWTLSDSFGEIVALATSRVYRLVPNPALDVLKVRGPSPSLTTSTATATQLSNTQQQQEEAPSSSSFRFTSSNGGRNSTRAKPSDDAVVDLTADDDDDSGDHCGDTRQSLLCSGPSPVTRKSSSRRSSSLAAAAVAVAATTKLEEQILSHYVAEASQTSQQLGQQQQHVPGTAAAVADPTPSATPTATDLTTNSSSSSSGGGGLVGSGALLTSTSTPMPMPTPLINSTATATASGCSGGSSTTTSAGRRRVTLFVPKHKQQQEQQHEAQNIQPPDIAPDAPIASAGGGGGGGGVHSTTNAASAMTTAGRMAAAGWTSLPSAPQQPQSVVPPQVVLPVLGEEQQDRKLVEVRRMVVSWCRRTLHHLNHQAQAETLEQRHGKPKGQQVKVEEEEEEVSDRRAAAAGGDSVAVPAVVVPLMLVCVNSEQSMRRVMQRLVVAPSSSSGASSGSGGDGSAEFALQEFNAFVARYKQKYGVFQQQPKHQTEQSPSVASGAPMDKKTNNNSATTTTRFELKKRSKPTQQGRTKAAAVDVDDDDNDGVGGERDEEDVGTAADDAAASVAVVGDDEDDEELLPMIADHRRTPMIAAARQEALRLTQQQQQVGGATTSTSTANSSQRQSSEQMLAREIMVATAAETSVHRTLLSLPEFLPTTPPPPSTGAAGGTSAAAAIQSSATGTEFLLPDDDDDDDELAAGTGEPVDDVAPPYQYEKKQPTTTVTSSQQGASPAVVPQQKQKTTTGIDEVSASSPRAGIGTGIGGGPLRLSLVAMSSTQITLEATMMMNVAQEGVDTHGDRDDASSVPPAVAASSRAEVVDVDLNDDEVDVKDQIRDVCDVDAFAKLCDRNRHGTLKNTEQLSGRHSAQRLQNKQIANNCNNKKKTVVMKCRVCIVVNNAVTAPMIRLYVDAAAQLYAIAQAKSSNRLQQQQKPQEEPESKKKSGKKKKKKQTGTDVVASFASNAASDREGIVLQQESVEVFFLRKVLLYETDLRAVRTIEGALAHHAATTSSAAFSPCPPIKIPSVAMLVFSDGSDKKELTAAIASETKAFEWIAKWKAGRVGQMFASRTAKALAEAELLEVVPRSGAAGIGSGRRQFASASSSATGPTSVGGSNKLKKKDAIHAAVVKSLHDQNQDVANQETDPSLRHHQQQQDGPIVIVDERELKSLLPYQLYLRGVDVVPLTLTYGDYIVSPHCALERKSPSDLVQSLNSGRLLKQMTHLCRLYPTAPTLLIEFDRSVRFRLSHTINPAKAEVMSNYDRQIYKRLCMIATKGGGIFVVWSRSPPHTAAMLAAWKRRSVSAVSALGGGGGGGSLLAGWCGDNPDVNDPALTAQSARNQKEVLLAAMTALKRLPGVTTDASAQRLVDSCGGNNTLRGLATCTLGDLSDALGSAANGAKLHNFLHKPLR